MNNLTNFSNDQKDTDDEKGLTNVFTQTKFDTSPKTEVSPKRGYFSYPENFMNQPATRYFSLKFDADGELLSVKDDALHVNYVLSDYVSFYTANFSCDDSSAIFTKFIQDPFQSYPITPHLNLHFHKKANLEAIFGSVYY